MERLEYTYIIPLHCGGRETVFKAQMQQSQIQRKNKLQENSAKSTGREQLSTTK